jgi:hypothetical protein
MSEETGFIGDSLREFLEGEDDKYADQYNGRVRNRTEAALFDFYYLFEYLEQDQVKKLFGSNFASVIQEDNHQEAASKGGETVEEEDLEQVPNPPATRAYIAFAIAFFLRGLNYDEQSVIPRYEEATGRQQPMFDQFSDTVEQGIHRYLREKQDVYADVNVKIELENIRPSDEILQDIEDTDKKTE